MDPATLSRSQIFLSDTAKNREKIGPIPAQLYAFRRSDVVGLISLKKWRDTVGEAQGFIFQYSNIFSGVVLIVWKPKFKR